MVEDLAHRGAQLILLSRCHTDIWTVQHIEDLRDRTGNHLIYSETCDLSSLHSIRLFATKWIDNSPPRRLDMIVCCAGVFQPPFKARQTSKDNVEIHWATNYLAYYHLLTLLSPVIRVQPPDRDVRIIFATCAFYALGPLDLDDVEFKARGYPMSKPWNVYGASKLALMVFAKMFQETVTEYKRPDGYPSNVHCILVDPGLTRSPMTRRVLSMGSLWGLLLYLMMWPMWWIVLKSCREGAETILFAAMSQEVAKEKELKLYRDCAEAMIRRPEVFSKSFGEKLWKLSADNIKQLEKASAVQRKINELKSKEKIIEL